jgi:RimJ/RimL family protein N-acetyltransferase
LDWFCNGDPDHPSLGLWATIHKATGDFIGRCGLIPWTIDGREEVEVAYLLAKADWRQGLVGSGAALVRWFEELQLARVIAADRAGMRRRSGRHEGGLRAGSRDGWGEKVMYAIVIPATSAVYWLSSFISFQVVRRVPRTAMPHETCTV